MGHALEELLEWIFRNADDLLRGMKGLAGFFDRWGGYFIRLLVEIGRRAVNPEFLTTFAIAGLTTFGAVVIFASLHLLITYARRRTSQVFVSYHHEREMVAAELCEKMTIAGIKTVRLPFTVNRDHDELLDEVKNMIRVSDVLVCVPGDRSSFVESEVSMAFILEKPLLFIVSPNEVAQIPNTAKKGYPIFVLESLRQRGYRPLVGLCSYLCADVRSNLELYKSVLSHFAACGSIVFIAFLCLLYLFSYISDPSFGEELSRMSNVAQGVNGLNKKFMMLTFMCLVATILLVPYSIFVATRFAFRKRVRRLVSGMRFADSYIPATLGYDFFKEDLTSVLYLGEILAQHEIKSDSITLKQSSKEKDAVLENSSTTCPETLAWELHAGNCSKCGRAGPVDIHYSYRVWSFVSTRYNDTEDLCCRRCAVRAQLVGMCYSLTLGWWGPLGLIYTPLQVFRNLIALMNPPRPSHPSARLIELLTLQVREPEPEMVSLNQTEGMCPNCGMELTDGNLECRVCSWITETNSAAGFS
jgi:hypothetical protein